MHHHWNSEKWRVYSLKPILQQQKKTASNRDVPVSKRELPDSNRDVPDYILFLKMFKTAANYFAVIMIFLDLMDVHHMGHSLLKCHSRFNMLLKNIHEYHHRQQFCCSHDIFGGCKWQVLITESRGERRCNYLSNYLPSIYIQIYFQIYFQMNFIYTRYISIYPDIFPADWYTFVCLPCK